MPTAPVAPTTAICGDEFIKGRDLTRESGGVNFRRQKGDSSSGGGGEERRRFFQGFGEVLDPPVSRGPHHEPLPRKAL